MFYFVYNKEDFSHTYGRVKKERTPSLKLQDILLTVFFSLIHNFGFHLSEIFCLVNYVSLVLNQKEPVESWGICANEADKSLRTVRSTRLRLYTGLLLCRFHMNI